MSDELKHLRDALNDSAPRPGQEARGAALDAALRAFDDERRQARRQARQAARQADGQKNPAAPQGNAAAERPTEVKPPRVNLLKGLITMTTEMLNWKNASLAGASLAAIAIAAVMLPRVMETHPPATTPSAPGEAKPAAKVAKPAANVAAHEAKKAGRAAEAEGVAAAVEKAPSILSLDAARPQVAASRPTPASAPMMAEKRAAARPMIAPSGPMPYAISPSPEALPPAWRDQGRDRFRHFDDNPVKLVAEAPVSTFSIDVDTASYAFVRRMLNQGILPPRDAVRGEEIINYFDYDYPAPEDRTKPFRTTVRVLPSPWKQGARLMHIGIKGYEVKNGQRPPANLVFLIDTSGSMQAPDKLPLLVNSLRMMLANLRPDDTVAVVTYAGRAGTALPPTPVRERAKIISVLENLAAGGSTAGGEGIRQAYALAESAMRKGGVNRVILATDGDFNVGIRDPRQLEDFVARKRDSGITLSVLGFGQGNYNDLLMQALAQNGNGNAHYIDTLNEARKALVRELSGTLFTIASDVKIQVEFNPATVSEYRLIGYETRKLKREDFNNDKVDAGDIGAGHTVTAIYEFIPRGHKGWLDAPRYARPATPATGGKADEYAHVKIRYKLPGEKTSRLMTRAVSKADEVGSLDAAPADVRFSIAAASFAQLLRGGKFTGSMTWDDVIAMGLSARGKDPFGYRAEFVNLARLAKTAAAMERRRGR